MSELRVLKVLGTVADMFKMFNSIIGPFYRTAADTLLRSSLAGLRLLSISVRRKGTSGNMTVGLGSQIYRNRSIYLILNIFPIILNICPIILKIDI